MKKLNVTLNISKIDKSKITERKYKNRDGEEVVEKNYKIEIVEMKEPKFVVEGDNWKMVKTHFVVEAQSKEEKNENKKPNYVGEGFTFESKNSVDIEKPKVKKESLEDIPF